MQRVGVAAGDVDETGAAEMQLDARFAADDEADGDAL